MEVISITEIGIYTYAKKRDWSSVWYDRWTTEQGYDYDGKKCTRLGDVSAGANMYGQRGAGEYDNRCSCCYLGISHTIDHHNNQIKRGENEGTI